MPQFELHLTEGALTEQAKAKLMESLSHLLLRMEGAPATEEALDITWGFLREYPTGHWTVGGKPAPGPRYRLVFTVPEGATGIHGPFQWGRREAFVRKATAQILAAEGAELTTVNAGRVWVHILEIPNGHWGSFNELTDVMDIATFVSGPAVRNHTEKGLRVREELRAAKAAAAGVHQPVAAAHS